MHKINVLYVEENQDGTTGGSHRCLLDLVQSIDRTKIRPYIVFYESNRLLDDFLKEKIRVTIFSRPKSRVLSTGYSSEFFLFRNIVALIQTSANIVRTDLYPFIYFFIFLLRNKIDIIHLNNTVFAGLLWIVAAKLTNTKVVVHERTFLSQIPRIFRYHHRLIDYILGMSNYSKEFLEKNGVDTKSYSTFYDRINIDEFYSKIKKDRVEVRGSFGIEKDEPLIGIVGNLQRWKGQLTVIQAVSLLKEKFPKLKCLIIGDSSKKSKDDIVYFDDIKKEIATNDIHENIILTGHRDDIPDMLNAIDIFIHASVKPEPYGLVVLEAMAMKKAIIASNEGGPAEMIENGISGILIEPGKPHILAKQIEYLLNHASKIGELGDNAYKRANERFSELNIEFVEKLYLALVSKNHLPPSYEFSRCQSSTTNRI